MSINSKNVLAELLKRVPEVQLKYDRSVNCWSGEFYVIHMGLYAVFDDLIGPWVMEQLSSDKLSEDLLVRIFSFFEDMAASLDEQIKMVLRIAILERLGFNAGVLEKAYKYMGPNTVEMFQKIENFNILNEFLKNIPELQSKYDQCLVWWENEFPGLHNIFGDVLNPYLIEQLNLPCLDEALLKRIFIFLESMANNPDEDVRNVLYVTILECLGDDSEVLRKAYKYMGRKTIKMSQEIEAFWGRDFNVFYLP